MRILSKYQLTIMEIMLKEFVVIFVGLLIKAFGVGFYEFTSQSRSVFQKQNKG